MVECTCKQCGKVFKADACKIAIGGGKYCGQSCYKESGRVIVNCSTCNKPLQVSKSQALKNKQNYCNRKCRAKGISTLVERTCLYCGKGFKVWPSKVKQGYGKYCSAQCGTNAHITRITKQCLVCGKEFNLNRSRTKYGACKYCSKGCEAIAKQKRTIKACNYCGKEFEVIPSREKRNNNYYCSAECYSKVNIGETHYWWKYGNTKPYRGKTWIKQRNLARKRDGGVCQLCHRKQLKGEKQFPIHHIKPYREFNGDDISANDLSNLIMLCHQCHPSVEQGKLPSPKRLL